MCVPKTLPLSWIQLLVLMLPWQTITWQFWSFMCYCSTAIQIWAKIHPLTTCCHFTSKVMSLKPKQISVLLSKSLRNTLIFTWQPACFTLPLFFCSSVSTGESVCLWHICNRWCQPSFESDQCICIVLCQRLSGWVHFPLPSAPSPLWKASDVRRCTAEDQIKSMQLFISAVRGLWPRHSWRQACETKQCRKRRLTFDLHSKLERAPYNKQAHFQYWAAPVFGTPKILMDLFTILICSLHCALPCAASVCVCNCHPDKLRSFLPHSNLPVHKVISGKLGNLRECFS